MEKVLGIDIGGTSIKVGMFSREGALEAATKIPTGELVSMASFAKVTEGLKRLVAEHGASPEEVVGLGLDIPGAVDRDGRVGMVPNIALDADGLLEALRRTFANANLALANDANAAAIGEMWQGAAKGIDSFVLLAIGTGVGGGIVVDGKLVAGASGATGELGHITVNEDESEHCGCGRRGCLEQYSSATGIVNGYKKACAARGISPVSLSGPTDTLSVFEAYRAGDQAAQQAVACMCDRLGFAMAQIATIVDPQAFLIGGGVSGGFNLFSQALSKAYHQYCLPSSAVARILPTALGNDAAMYGCAYLAFKGFPV